MTTVVIVLTWQFTPFMMLILLAGLQGQAKAITGGRPGRRRRHLAHLHLDSRCRTCGCTSRSACLLGAVIIIQVFDPIAILTKGTGGTKTLAYLLYERAFIGLDVGEAAAYGVVTVVLTIIVATMALRTLFKVFMAGGSR